MSSLLTDIKSPQLNADYAKNLSGVFDNIHRNFEQIVSTPYLAGAAGAPFEAQEVKIWKDNSNSNQTKWTLNEWGVRLVNAIFFDNDEESQFSEDEVYSENGVSIALVEQHIEKSVNNIKYQKVNGLHNTYVYENLFVNDTLYLYITRDDSNEISNQYLGQYYHFTDARLANREGIRKVQEDNWAFEDASCFLYYTPDKDDSLKGTFHKIYSLPVVYYDTTNSDWCWMFDNNKTGISCKGIQGEQGVDGVKFHMVRVDHTADDMTQHENTYSAPDSLYYNTVISYAAMANDTSTGNQEWKDVDDSFIKEVHNGDAAFAIISSKYNATTKKVETTYKDIDITMCTLYKGTEKDGETEKAVIKASYDRVNMFQQWDNHLKDEMQQIGKRKADLDHWNRGLFVPAISFGDNSPKSYMIWADSDINAVHIGLVEAALIDNKEASPVSDKNAIIALDNDTEINNNLSISANLSAAHITISDGSDLKGDVKIGKNLQVEQQVVVKKDIIAKQDVQVERDVLVKGPVRNLEGNQYIDLYDDILNIKGDRSVYVQAQQIWLSAGDVYFDKYQNVANNTLADGSRIEGLPIKNLFKLSNQSVMQCGDNVSIIPGAGPNSIDEALNNYTKGDNSNVIQYITMGGTDSWNATDTLNYNFNQYSSTVYKSLTKRCRPWQYAAGNKGTKKVSKSELPTFLSDTNYGNAGLNKDILTSGGVVHYVPGDLERVLPNFKLLTTNIKSQATKLLNKYRPSKASIIDCKIVVKAAKLQVSLPQLQVRTNFKATEYLGKYGKQSTNSLSSTDNDTYFSAAVIGLSTVNGSMVERELDTTSIEGVYVGDKKLNTSVKLQSQDRKYRCHYIISNKAKGSATAGFAGQTKENHELGIRWNIPLYSDINIPETIIYQEDSTGIKQNFTNLDSILLAGGLNLDVDGVELCSSLYNPSASTSSATYGPVYDQTTQGIVKNSLTVIGIPSTMKVKLEISGSYRNSSSKDTAVKVFKNQVVVEGTIVKSGSTAKVDCVCRITAGGIEVKDSAGGSTSLTLGKASEESNEKYEKLYKEMLDRAQRDLQDYNTKEIIPKINDAGSTAVTQVRSAADNGISNLTSAAQLLAGTSTFGEGDSLWSLKNGYLTEFTGAKGTALTEIKNGMTGATAAIAKLRDDSKLALTNLVGDPDTLDFNADNFDTNTLVGKIGLLTKQSSSKIKTSFNENIEKLRKNNVLTDEVANKAKYEIVASDMMSL